MNAKVVKAKGRDSIIMVNENKPEWGSVMVIETRTKFSDGFINTQNRVGFLTAKVEDLKKLNYQDGQAIPAKIVYKESFEPSFEGQIAKQYPASHPKAGETITSGGAPVYLTRIVCDETSPEVDSLLLTDRDEVAVKVAEEKSVFAK